MYFHTVGALFLHSWLNCLYTHQKEDQFSCRTTPEKDPHQHLKTSPFNLSTRTMPSMMRAWQIAGKFLRSRCFLLQLICSCYLASLSLWPSYLLWIVPKEVVPAEERGLIWSCLFFAVIAILPWGALSAFRIISIVLLLLNFPFNLKVHRMSSTLSFSKSWKST